MRVDGTTASGYWEVTQDGLLQIKVMLATLDSLGMPVAVDVVADQRTDDQLYLPIIDRVPASLGHTSLLYVGDSKLEPALAVGLNTIRYNFRRAICSAERGSGGACRCAGWFRRSPTRPAHP